MRVLVTYVSAGAGHQRAAKAVVKALEECSRQHNRQIETKLVDALDYSTHLFRKSYPAIYLFAITYVPLIWGIAYLVLDNRVIYFFAAFFRRVTNKLNSAKFIQLLHSFNPDLVISTHFYPSEVIANQRRKGKFKGRLISVITDFRVHAFWVTRGIDKFVVAAGNTKEELIKRGIAGEKVEVLGIPIDPVFARDEDRNSLINKLNLRRNLFTILIASGGFGVGPIEELVAELENIPHSIQLIIVCGHNKLLYDHLISRNSKIFCKIYGFCENMHELMGVSDVIVTKSGGLTSSECLAKSLPMIIIAPVPGQETRNCGVLVREGAALKMDKPAQINGLIAEFIDQPQKISRVKENIKRSANPNAASDVVNLSLSLGEEMEVNK